MSNPVDEGYVSFETAKLLKEKGFDRLTQFVWYERCPASLACTNNEAFKPKFDYFYLDRFTETSSKFSNNECIPDYISGNVYCAPALWEAMKWLRDSHDKSIEPSSHGFKANGVGWTASIFNLKNQDEDYGNLFFLSYEEAVEAAIKYCLENLI